MVLLPTNLKNINRRLKTVKIIYKIHINIQVPYILEKLRYC